MGTLTNRMEISLNRELMMKTREALLLIVDALERALDISPRTSELRKQSKRS